MKEAAGEANMTVITIVLIGVVLVAGGIIVNTMMKNTKKQACCANAGGKWSGNKCSGGDNLTYNACISSKGDDKGVEIGQ